MKRYILFIKLIFYIIITSLILVIFIFSLLNYINKISISISILIPSILIGFPLGIIFFLKIFLKKSLDNLELEEKIKIIIFYILGISLTTILLIIISYNKFIIIN